MFIYKLDAVIFIGNSLFTVTIYSFNYRINPLKIRKNGWCFRQPKFGFIVSFVIIQINLNDKHDWAKNNATRFYLVNFMNSPKKKASFNFGKLNVNTQCWEDCISWKEFCYYTTGAGLMFDNTYILPCQKQIWCFS